MFALLLIAIVIAAIIGVLLWDQKRLNERKAVERGLHRISERASQRLQFRSPRRDDLDFYLEMARDPVAAEANGWNGHEVAAIEELFGDRKRFAALRANELVAFERATSIRVGTARFSPSPLGPPPARSIGIHVHPAHRNQGYGREVMAAAILLMQYGPEPIHVGTLTTNHGMQRIMEQLEFDPEPRTFDYAAPNGETYDAYWYECGADVHPPAGLYGV